MKRARFSVLATVAASFVFISAFGLVHKAEAKQCVWNKAGFVLNVSWINPDTKAVVKTDKFPLAQGRCFEASKPHQVILSIEGGEVAGPILRASLGVAIAIVGGAAGAVGCAATALTACPAIVAGGAAGMAAGVTAISQYIPDAKSIFYAGTPSTTNYLDVWGTIFDPQTGPGGPVN